MDNKKIHSEISEITVNQKIKDTQGTYLLRIKNPFIASNFKPGQFVMIKSNLNGFDPLLSRPYSIFNRFNENEFEVLYRLSGKGTRFLSSLKQGDAVLVTGPLGNGFDIGIVKKPAFERVKLSDKYSSSSSSNSGSEEKQRIHVIVAGGIGIASLYFLPQYMFSSGKDIQDQAQIQNRNQDQVKDYDPGNKTILYYGSRTGTELYFRYSIHANFDEVYFSTDDGTFGYSGNILELIDKNIDEYLRKDTDVRFYSCGPKPMIAELIRKAKAWGLSLQVSLEEVFACGLGVCLGCVVKCKGSGNNDYVYKRVCKDGPVFYSDELY